MHWIFISILKRKTKKTKRVFSQTRTGKIKKKSADVSNLSIYLSLKFQYRKFFIHVQDHLLFRNRKKKKNVLFSFSTQRQLRRLLAVGRSRMYGQCRSKQYIIIVLRNPNKNHFRWKYNSNRIFFSTSTYTHLCWMNRRYDSQKVNKKNKKNKENALHSHRNISKTEKNMDRWQSCLRFLSFPLNFFLLPNDK